jgi:primosomal protein N' (replication factor Y) (superfamily II helicase)
VQDDGVVRAVAGDDVFAAHEHDDGAWRQGAPAGAEGFAAEGGGVDAEQVGELVGDALGDVRRGDEGKDGGVDALGDAGGGAAGVQYLGGAVVEGGGVGALDADHGGHVVSEDFAVYALRRGQHPIEFRAGSEEGWIRAQEFSHERGALGGVGARIRGWGATKTVFHESVFQLGVSITRDFETAPPLIATEGVNNLAGRKHRVPVLLAYPFQGPFDYAVPAGEELVPGDIVLVPLNRRQEVGVVWDAPSGPSVADSKLKPVSARLEAPGMPAALRKFVDWVAGYTLAAPGAVLAMALRVNALAPQPPVAGWQAGAVPEGVRLTPQRRRVLDVLGHKVMPGAELARAADVGGSVIRGMADAGLLVAQAVPVAAPFGWPNTVAAAGLSDAQEGVARELRAAVAAGAFSVTLLDGVTGSGKTEVYLEAVAACVAAGKQALILLPEIALSAQFLGRFERRFGVAPAVWHSDLSSRTRRVTWRAVAEGAAPVVVGARSALFLPFPDLGLVVVDEEHETAFKQEDGVVYHARDMAVVRARFSDAPAVLVSATPSLETLANVEAGRYRHLELKARHGGASLPAIEAVDLRVHPPARGKFLSPVLIEAVQECFARGEQAMLFLNRRGYAPLTLCRACGHRLACPNCTAWLVEHRARRELACHHCGRTAALPKECPVCKAEGSLAPIGPGVERITEEAAEVFPEARRLVMASDTMPGPHAAADAARAIEAREVDLLIGTQIVAKGWHFPHLTLVGVVDADLGLAGGDLRASERTVQLLHQVSGRAGRAEAPGRVLLQTFAPAHPVMAALIGGDLAEFCAREADARRPGNWPPFGRLAALIVSADTADAADRCAQELGRAAPGGDGVLVLGPTPAPLAILRGRHRRRLLLKTRREIAVQPLLREWLGKVAVARGTRVDVDVDPVSFL